MKKTILMLVAALFVLVAVNAQTRKVTPRIRKSGNPAQVIKGKTVPTPVSPFPVCSAMPVCRCR